MFCFAYYRSKKYIFDCKWGVGQGIDNDTSNQVFRKNNLCCVGKLLCLLPEDAVQGHHYEYKERANHVEVRVKAAVPTPKKATARNLLLEFCFPGWFPHIYKQVSYQ